MSPARNLDSIVVLEPKTHVPNDGKNGYSIYGPSKNSFEDTKVTVRKTAYETEIATK